MWAFAGAWETTVDLQHACATDDGDFERMMARFDDLEKQEAAAQNGAVTAGLSWYSIGALDFCMVSLCLRSAVMVCQCHVPCFDKVQHGKACLVRLLFLIKICIGIIYIDDGRWHYASG